MNVSTIQLILEVIALVLGIVELFRSACQSLLAVAVILVCIALLLPRVA